MKQMEDEMISKKHKVQKEILLLIFLFCNILEWKKKCSILHKYGNTSKLELDQGIRPLPETKAKTISDNLHLWKSACFPES